LDERERDETVRRIAREGDPDRALAALFAPRDARSGLNALIAFNVELSRIADQVSEPDLGAIRLQWWRDAVAEIAAGGFIGHPVADALGKALARPGLSHERLTAMIDARRFDIAVKIMPDWPSLEDYLAGTAAALFALQAECLGDPGPGLASAARQAGIAYGLTGLMRALPVHAACGRLTLPADALRAHGTSPDAVLAGRTSEGLRTVLAALREKARTALGQARREVSMLDPPIRIAFLPLGLVEPYLAALANARDPLREIAGINPLHRLWRLGRWG